MPNEYLIDEPESGTALATVILAHGAGAGMDSDFMQLLAQGLASQGLRVQRFEFPYMAARRHGGGRRPPNPMPVLLDDFRCHLQQLEPPLFLAGKSMGGRVASLLADELQAAGLICFGYPFHPPGKPHKLRTEHLQSLQTPGLIVQGSRDPFGRPEEVADYALCDLLRLHWLDTADHDFKPLKSTGKSQAQMIEEAAAVAAAFVRDQLGNR